MPIIYQTFKPGEARITAAIVTDSGMADILVYLTGNRGMARDEAHWFITDKRNEYATKIYFGSIGFSDLNVSFTTHIGKAGWQKDHRLKGKL